MFISASSFCMLAQRGKNYEHVHIISITQISFSYVQISVSIQIRRSWEKNRQSRVQIRRSRVEIRRSRVEIRRSGSWNSSKWKLKFVEVEVEIRRSRQTNRRSRMLKHFFVQYDNFFYTRSYYRKERSCCLIPNGSKPACAICWIRGCLYDPALPRWDTRQGDLDVLK
jgi:hypothetical protein